MIGRQSLTRLAVHMADFNVFSIELSKNYDTAAWKEFTARFASLLRGSLRESICSARPPPGGGSGKMVRFSDRNSAKSARSSASKACSMPLGSKPRLALREC